MKNSKLPSTSKLSDTLTNVLHSAFSETFPDSLVTSLKENNLQFFDRPNGLNLLNDSSTSLTPLLFSDNPDDNFPNTYAKFVDTLTAGSDINIVPIDDQEVKIIWGRQGSDSLIGFDPGIDHQGKRRIDVLVGDYTDEELFALRTGQEVPSREWSNRFILGDWQQPYYVENDPHSLGLNQFALIADFNPSEDIIQLHGTSQDYQLENTSLGTAIFWHQGNSNDLIGVVGGVSDLSLTGDYFDYKGNTAPETVLDDAKHIGTPAIDFLFASSVDAQGNLYVGGGTDGSLAGPNLGGRDAWLAKYDSNGNEQWSRQFGTTGNETIWDMASDGNNLYVVGNTSGELDNNTTQGGNDVFLAKYDSYGNQQWIKQYGTPTFDESFSVSTDTSGNIYAAGHTLGNLGGLNQNSGQFLGANDASAFLGYPSTDSFVAKYDSNGNQQWIKQFGTPALDDNWGVATDKDGNVYAGGNTKGDFGGTNAGAGNGSYDAWLVKLDTNGNQQWVKQFGSPDYDFLWDVKTDSKDNVYATGWTLGDLGGKNAGSYDAWLAKYDTNGTQQWIKQFGTSGDDAAYMNGLDVDSNDNIFVAGYTDGNLGGENAGSYDAWVAKYDSNGNQQWIKQFGTSEYDTATTVRTDTSGNLYVSGITEGSLGGINAGSYDSWVLKLDANDGTIENFTGNNFHTNNNLNDSNANVFI